MKPKILPLSFPSKNEDFDTQLQYLHTILSDDLELLSPVELGTLVSKDVDGYIFPQILGDAYKMFSEFEVLASSKKPIIVVTSEFGSFSMWDWEINNYLKDRGVHLIMPYSLEQTKTICNSLRTKKRLSKKSFLIYQDNPGEGMQPQIFKRFYWWEQECIDNMKRTFGVGLKYKSFKELGQRAQSISDHEAEQTLLSFDTTDVFLEKKQILKAVKLTMVLQSDLEEDPSIDGMGINCLNESAHSDTTPCLSWDWMFSKYGILWACEGDIVSLVTKYILYHSLHTPLMMSNIYPFLMGKTATSHEKIPGFPKFVDNPQNYVLMGHCGFFGLAPRSFCDSWSCRPPVLGIVSDTAHALDVQFKEGDVTMIKLNSKLDSLMMVEGELKGYVQYDKSSDCRNGGIIKVPDGNAFMKNVWSHHQILMTGHQKSNIEFVASVFGLSLEVL